MGERAQAAISRSRGDRPLYAQLANEILRSIEEGHLRVGDRVDSEPELMRRHGVSRATAGKALERLERVGVVRREQGRGTFVQAAPLLQRIPELGSFTDSVRQRGQVPTQRLLGLERLEPEAAGPLAVYLATDDTVVRLTRLRLVDGAPVGLHVHLLPGELADRAGLGEDSFAPETASLYRLLADAGESVHEAEEHLRSVAASPAEAELLEVGTGAPLMRVLRVSYGSQRIPMEVADARYLGERFDYSVALARPGTPGASLAPRPVTTDKGAEDENQPLGHGRAGGDPPGHGGRVR
jgi:GntR family transcriptional regulator